MIAIFLEIKLVDNKEQSCLEMHCDSYHEEVVNKPGGYFAS